MPTVGDRIKEFRESLGWTQETLAEKAGLSKGFLSDVENNKRDISSSNVLKIANTMGASLDFLLRGELVTRQAPTPIEIPPELSSAAELEGWSYSDTLTLLETHRSVIARRSSRSIKPPTTEEWKKFYKWIKRAFPEDEPKAGK
jgi:transcriptional regulator with XRE-family HTH domain